MDTEIQAYEETELTELEMLRDIHRVVMKIDELVQSVTPADISKVASSPLLSIMGSFLPKR